MNDLDAIRQECWAQAVHAFGTYYVFENRANRLRRRLRVLAFLGIGFPVLLGMAYSAYGASSWFTKATLAVALVLTVLLAVTSVLSLVYKWIDAYAYASEAMSANRALFDKYRILARDPPPLKEARARFDLLQVETQARTASDERQGFSDNEKRMGMCAALRQLQRPCATCGNVPKSMTANDCGTCGNFEIPRF